MVMAASTRELSIVPAIANHPCRLGMRVESFVRNSQSSTSLANTGLSSTSRRSSA